MLRILVLIFFISCGKQSQLLQKTPQKNLDKITIAFGSCSDQDKVQPLWDDIISEGPDLWIWLGDNIYGDSEDKDVMRSKYNKQKSHPLYQKLMSTTPIIGTWDDHDYGINDGGRHFPAKKSNQKEFLDFLDVPKDDPRRSREGIYGSYVLEHSIAKIEVFLLDTRYFRDDPKKVDGVFDPNHDGTVLGEAQWKWLEEKLSNSNADIHVFASGIQVIPEEHKYEKWSNFSEDRNRLFDLIKSKNISSPIFISGDRHIGEISKIEVDGKTFYDVTSSSLTHGWRTIREEPNRHRIGNIVYALNYGVLEISAGHSIKAVLKGDNQSVEEKHQLAF